MHLIIFYLFWYTCSKKTCLWTIKKLFCYTTLCSIPEATRNDYFWLYGIHLMNFFCLYWANTNLLNMEESVTPIFPHLDSWEYSFVNSHPPCLPLVWFVVPMKPGNTPTFLKFVTQYCLNNLSSDVPSFLNQNIIFQNWVCQTDHTWNITAYWILWTRWWWYQSIVTIS